MMETPTLMMDIDTRSDPINVLLYHLDDEHPYKHLNYERGTFNINRYTNRMKLFFFKIDYYETQYGYRYAITTPFDISKFYSYMEDLYP